ncbi:SPARC-like protein 1 [Acomys russatus]|uniref:SPARC-like protein 1 n=1 Tax=Acomys russatus TaxID=60746 RepID=UPI0021E309E2|nr:SPARC-like protein 1 [Acomys russatus]XP_051026571.1 SPARC-like protein 1 [Acomys russatus]
MKAALCFLCVLGTAAAIPTNAKFLSDRSNPTTATLVTPDPVIEVEAAADIENHPTSKAEEPPALNSDEETPEESTEQDKPYSHEVDLKDEDSDGDVSVNTEYAPTERMPDLQGGTREPQEEELQEDAGFPTTASSSSTESNHHADIAKGEDSHGQPDSDSHQQLNKSGKHNPNLTGEESQKRDPDTPDEEEEDEEELEPGDGGPSESQEGEKEESPEEQPTSKQEGNSHQSDDSSQPTQVSKMPKNGFEQENQGQEGDSNAEWEDDTTASSKKHVQHTEQQNQEGKAIGSQKDAEEKAVFTEPTNDGAAAVPGNRGASDNGGNDDAQRGAADDYFIPSQEFLEAERMHSLSYYLKHGEETADENENENAHKSEAGDDQEAEKAESLPNAEPTSDEGNSRDPSADSCTNFQCKRGHTCQTDQQGKPHCVCQEPETCPPAKILDQVCGTDNQTYTSSCHLFATKCRLEGTKKGHQLQLDYFGACKSIPACTDFEVAQFPLRMRDWLKNILIQLYESNPKHDGYLNEKQRSKVKKIYLDEKRLLAGDHPIELLLRDFKKNYHMYVFPVHWQFNELDQHPADR